MKRSDTDDIITFHQGPPDKPGVQSYSFRIATEFRDVDGKKVELPKKLGDGNFGMVFEAPATSKDVGTFALKVMYRYRATDSIQGSNDSNSRILEELHIGENLPKMLEGISADLANSKDPIDHDFPMEGDRQNAWLVLPRAYCENFTDFVGREILERQDVKFSKFAYIMEKFDYTLKDLMEEPIDGEKGGYGRLKKSTLRERECSTIPILDQLARGLQILHAAGLRHQDIKPANIYVKNMGTNFVLRLGDLGFLKPQDPTRSGTAVASIDTVGIGTKHYRSIEQIDFTDVAECDVQVGEDGRSATLSTRDPKFLGTIMRKGDLAYFAKSNSHRLFKVEELKKDYEEGSITIRVLHNTDPTKNENTGKPESHPLVSDKKTQVAFFKNPGTKTDLFGLGCILYDILTIGDSPERFYELLRRFDTKEVDIQERILDLYTTWLVGTLEDADIGAIFSRVNRGNDRRQTVHRDVLGFLLKCMMSDAKGSYYDGFGFNAAELEGDDQAMRKAKIAAVVSWTKVIRELKEIGEWLGAQSYEEHKVNVLTKKLSDAVVTPPKKTESDETHISDDLQASLSLVLPAYLDGVSPFSRMDDTAGSRVGLSDLIQSGGARGSSTAVEHGDVQGEEDKRAYRWLMSGRLIKRIADWIDINVKHSHSSLWSLSQEHVGVKGHAIVAWRTVVAGAEADIVKSLRARDPLLTRIRLFASRFEPIWWSYGTRRVRLAYSGNPLEVTRTDNGEMMIDRVSYEFMDFAFVSVPVNKDDFVLASDGASSVVFRITNVGDDGRLSLRVCSDVEGPSEKADKKDVVVGDQELVDVLNSAENTYFIKNPNAVNYYAGMLSMYMFHFLIWGGVGQREAIVDFPAEIYVGIRKYPVRFNSTPSTRLEKRGSGTKGIGWEGFRDATLELIMWLGLGGFSYDRDGNVLTDEIGKWRLAMEEVECWYGELNEIGLKRGRIDNWNLLTTSPESDEFVNYARRDFRAITQREWETTCGTYVGGSIGETDEGKRTTGKGVKGKPWYREFW